MLSRVVGLKMINERIMSGALLVCKSGRKRTERQTDGIDNKEGGCGIELILVVCLSEVSLTSVEQRASR